MKPGVYARVLAFVVVLAWTAPAYGQLGSIFGKVIDRDGKPMADAVVSIDRQEVGLHYDLKTDKNGIYSRRGVDDGSYKVSVIQNGVTVATVDVVVSLGYRVDKDIDLRTIDKQNQQAASGPATISKAQRDAEQKANAETQGAFNAGVAALTARNFDEAAKQFNLAAEKRPNLPVIHARLGQTYQEAKKYAEAADAYKKATELKADEPDYFYNLGIASVRASRFDAAKAAVARAVELDPARGATSFSNLGALLSERGQDKDAADAFQRAIKQNPKVADPYYQYGLLLLKSPSTMAEAATQFEKYLQLAPKGDNAATAKQLMDAAKAAK